MTEEELREALVEKMVSMGWLGDPGYRPHTEDTIDQLMPLIRARLTEVEDQPCCEHNTARKLERNMRLVAETRLAEVIALCDAEGVATGWVREAAIRAIVAPRTPEDSSADG